MPKTTASHATQAALDAIPAASQTELQRVVDEIASRLDEIKSQGSLRIISRFISRDELKWLNMQLQSKGYVVTYHSAVRGELSVIVISLPQTSTKDLLALDAEAAMRGISRAGVTK